MCFKPRHGETQTGRVQSQLSSAVTNGTGGILQSVKGYFPSCLSVSRSHNSLLWKREFLTWPQFLTIFVVFQFFIPKIEVI